MSLDPLERLAHLRQRHRLADRYGELAGRRGLERLADGGGHDLVGFEQAGVAENGDALAV
jgi:hypothetical protein